MLKPVPIVIDGNLYLNSISSAIFGTMSSGDIVFNSKQEDPMFRGRGMILKTFLTTILKTVVDCSKKGYSPTHISIVWDRKLNGKYKKTLILDALNDGHSYKSDRSFVTKEDLLNENLTDKERESLEAKMVLNKEFLESRNFIQDNFHRVGLYSYSLPGWEADDIDYVWGLETTKLGGLQIHCSADSDWQYHLSGKDILWQLIRGKTTIKTESIVRDDKEIPKGMSLLEYIAIINSALGSHNNLLRTVDPSIKRFTKKYRNLLLNGDDSMISNKTRYLAQKKTFDILSFSGVNSVQDLFSKMLNNFPNSDSSELSKLIKELKINDSDSRSIINSYDSVKSVLLNSRLSQI